MGSARSLTSGVTQRGRGYSYGAGELQEEKSQGMAGEQPGGHAGESQRSTGSRVTKVKSWYHQGAPDSGDQGISEERDRKGLGVALFQDSCQGGCQAGVTERRKVRGRRGGPG